MTTSLNEYTKAAELVRALKNLMVEQKKWIPPGDEKMAFYVITEEMHQQRLQQLVADMHKARSREFRAYAFLHGLRIRPARSIVTRP